MLLTQIRDLIGKEFRLEFRQKFPFTGMLIYIFSTLFICYLSFFQIIDVTTWNALFWIMIVFAAVNAVAKSFLQETAGHHLFFYTLVDPRALIIARIFYNSVLLFALSILTLVAYAILLGNIVDNVGLFVLCILLASIGLSGILTLVSAIASRANNSSALMAILGFPLLFPLLITILKFSKNIIDGILWSVNLKYMIVLIAINVIVIALAYVLFPYLWRE